MSELGESSSTVSPGEAWDSISLEVRWMWAAREATASSWLPGICVCVCVCVQIQRGEQLKHKVDVLCLGMAIKCTYRYIVCDT